MINSIVMALALASPNIERCADIADTAEVYMEFRQIHEMDVKSLYESVPKDSPYRDMQLAILTDLMDIPLYGSDVYKRRAIIDFKDRWFKKCMTGKVK